MKRIACLAAALTSVLFFGVPASSVAQDDSPVALRFTVGAAGGNWFIIGSGMAKIISDAYPEISISVVPGGFVSSITKTGTGESDIGVGFLTQATDAKLGRGPFREALPELRALTGGFSPTYFQVGVHAEYPAESLDEVVENAMPIDVAVGTPKMVAWSITQNVFGYFGKDMEELRKSGISWQSVNYSQATQLFKDRRVDGMMYALANPAAMFNEARLSRPIKFLSLSDSLITHMEEKWGFQRAVIAEGSYDGTVEKDVPTFKDTTGLFVPADMPDHVAYRLIRALAENAEKVRQIHPSIADFDPRVHWNVEDLHPGAVRYYKEQGRM